LGKGKRKGTGKETNYARGLMQPLSSRLFDEIVLKSWWVILFFLLAFFLFDQAMQKRSAEEKKLAEKLTRLQEEAKSSLLEREELKLELASQEDPAWIELVLIEKLGLVPEGQTKIYFKQ
jgi:hypothetical protein